MSFGITIVGLRKKANLSQRELAAAVGISGQYLNDIEHDRRKAPPSLLIYDLADELKVPYEYLFVVAGRLPDDVTVTGRGPAEVKAAVDLMREYLR